MNRRGFVGAVLAVLSGFFFPQKIESSIRKGQYLVTIDVDEDRMLAIAQKAGKKCNVTVPENERRAIEGVLNNHMGLLNRWYPGIIRIDVKSF